MTGEGSIPAPTNEVLNVLAKELGLNVAEIQQKPLHELALDSLQRLELSTMLVERGYSIGEIDAHRDLPIGALLDTIRPGHITSQSAVAPEETELPARSHRLRLSAITPDLMPWLFSLSTHPKLRHRWRFRAAVPSAEAFAADFWHGTLVQMLAVDDASNAPVGHLVCYGSDLINGTAMVGGIFLPELLGTGLPLEGIDLFLRYVFAGWPLRKLYLEVPEWNYSTFASGEGRFFTIEGRMKDHEYLDGRYWDKFICAIRRADLGLRDWVAL